MVAEELKTLEIRNVSFPFDWLRIYDLEKILKLLKEKYDGKFLEKLYHNVYPYEFVINNKYKVLHFHDDFNNFKKTKDKFDRRIKRLKKLIDKNENIIFFRYYPIDYNSYFSSFFNFPNRKPNKNKFIDEDKLCEIIINDGEIFCKYFNKPNVFLYQIIPFKNKILENKQYNVIKFQKNILFNDLKIKIGNNFSDQSIVKKHINKTLKYVMEAQEKQ
jgi:hypothetical protein